MKKQILTLMIASISLIGYAQVGVGTVDPETTLDVVGTNTTVVDGATDTAGILTSADGITVPSVTDASTTAINGVNDGQLVYDTTQKAFYYFNIATSTWTAVGARPDFTVGSGGVTTLTLTGSNNDFSANTDSNVYIVTTTAGFGTDVITLPTPATNSGRVIVVKNVGPKTLSVNNAWNTTLAITNTRSTSYICDGTDWTAVSN